MATPDMDGREVLLLRSAPSLTPEFAWITYTLCICQHLNFLQGHQPQATNLFLAIGLPCTGARLCLSRQ